MKTKSILLAAIAVFSASSAFADGGENGNKVKLKPYGFVRNYATFDSRAVKALAEDSFYFLPLDRALAPDGTDKNAVYSYNFYSITTRLGVDISGYKYGNLFVSGKIESDFYCLNSGGNTGTLRMRQAFMDLLWKNEGRTDYKLRIGQAWHPLAADMPHVLGLETGSPFNPFNRSAQVMFDAITPSGIPLTAGATQQMQYRSAGPKTADVTASEQSNRFQKHAFPELYAGVSYRKNGFLGRLGVDVVNIRPQYGYADDGKKYSNLMTGVSPFIFLQYTGDKFQVKAKSVLAQSGEHMQLNGGYAAVAGTTGTDTEYTPISSTVSFLSASWLLSQQFKLMAFAGYQKNLGAAKDIDPARVYFSGNGFKNIVDMFRVGPTLVYSIGKTEFGLEYSLTSVQYSDAAGLGTDGLPADTDNTHQVGNSRVLLMAKLNF